MLDLVLVETPIAVDGRVRAYGMAREEVVRNRNALVPLQGGMGSGWDVGYAALFLASEEARWITGICLPVDAGLTSVHPGTFTPMNQQTRY